MDYYINASRWQLWLDTAKTYVLQPWAAYQIAMIAALFGLAWILSLKVEPLLEERARNIKGNPGLLRMVVAIMRRMEWVFFILFLFIALVVLQELTWPSRSFLVAGALKLATAWFVIAVATRILRSRLISRLFALIIWVYFALSVFGLSDEVASYLDAFAVNVGEVRVSMLIILQAIALISVALWLAINVGNFVDRKIQQAEDITPSIKVLMGKFVKIGLILIASVVSLSAVGIDLTAFAVFSGAVGVGIGFGLQKVVSNFISGIIILMDKSIKPGDTITLGDTFGWIRELRARFVSVVTRDGREFLIPNEDFITQQVINWSFTDELVRLDVHFGVSYDSDPHHVIQVAKDATQNSSRVLGTKRVVCWMTGFGDSSIDFVVRFWIRDPQEGLTNIRGAVLLALWDAFRDHDIGFPFPHREIIMRTPVEVVQKSPNKAAASKTAKK